jgi:Spy/CpxP family protein refolding chaperone
MGPGAEHGMAPGMHEGAGGPIMMLGEELGLSPEQKQKLRTQLEAQRKGQEAAMKNRMAAMEKHMTALGNAFMADKFDAKKAGVGAQAPEAVKLMATEHLKFVETVLGVLTPEQRAKFAAHLREHAAHEGGPAHP